MILLLAAVVLGAGPVQGVDGGLSLAQVQELIWWHSPEINACLSGSPKRASVRYRFSVQPDGRVGQLAFLSSQKVESPRVTCVGSALEKWRFAAGDGGSVVEWDFMLASFDAGVPLEAEGLVPDQLADRWVDDAASCYDATKPGERQEGLLSLEAIALPSGDVVEASTLDVTPALAETTLPTCVQQRSLGWSLPASARARRVQANFVFATSERRAKAFFVPSAPAREIIARSPRLTGDGGGLDKNVIMAEIKRAQPRIRGCYELGLAMDRTLGGKVSVAFVIGPEGTVTHSEAAEVTLASDRVTNCILEVVNRMTFPPPKGGGNVNVTFPWILKAAGVE